MFSMRLVFDSVSFLFFVDIWMIEVGLFFGWIAGLLERWGRGVAHCLGKEEGKQFRLRDYFTSRYLILFGASINSQSIDTKSVAFWLQPHLHFWLLLGPPRVNFNHSYSNNYNWIFPSSWEKSVICFCLVSVSFDVFNEGPCGWWVCLDSTFMLSLSHEARVWNYYGSFTSWPGYK